MLSPPPPPQELVSNPEFILGGATRTDICQGALGELYRPPLNAPQFSPVNTGVPDELPARIVSAQTHVAKSNGGAAVGLQSVSTSFFKREIFSKHLIRTEGANQSSHRESRRRAFHPE